MSSYQILDSSPIRIPSLRDTDGHPRPLKRSASVASLPTPPRTRHKRSRSKAPSTTSRNASEDSDSASELDEDLGGGYAASISKATSKSADETGKDKGNYARVVRKKRRTTEVLPAQDEEEDCENAFWTGRSGGKASAAKKSPVLEDTDEDKSPSPALLKYRVRVPVSPPPSRRAPQVQPRASSVQRSRSRSPPPNLLLPELPVTPPRQLFLRAPPLPSKSKGKKVWPTRDSPDNPFLSGEDEAGTSKANGWESSDDELPVGEARERESTPTPAPVFEEKPTITYVFRGQKATFHNPLYDLPPAVIEASKLPIDHPDFEVAEACPPRRLFADKFKRKLRDRSQDSPTNGSFDPKRAKTAHLDASASEGEKITASTDSRRKVVFSDGTEREPVFTKPQGPDNGAERLAPLHYHAREERERREKDSKQRLAATDGLRAGAFLSERSDPALRAMGPVRQT